jgi:hypothetical protein
MTKPIAVPRLASSPTTLRTEPPESLKDSGFAVAAKLPAQYFNWLVGLTGDWLAHLDLVVGEVIADPSGSYSYPTSISVDQWGRVTAATSWQRVYANAKLDYAYAVAHDSEQSLQFESSRYASSPGIWGTTVGTFNIGERFKAPYTGYYHFDLSAGFEASGTEVKQQYICVRHSSDGRIVSKASSANDSTGGSALKTDNWLSCSSDVYLEANQYIYARAYQKNTAASTLNLNFAEMTFHRLA